MGSNTSFNIKNFLEINLAMVLLSTSGPLGRFIELPVPITIGIRSLIALLLLFLYCRLKGISFGLSSKDRMPVLVSGVLMGVYWLAYFMALQKSNVAIGMLSLFTYPVITAFLEPLFLKTRFQKMHLLLGILVLCGIYFLVPDFSFENSYTVAIGFGVFSALCYAVRNLILKKQVDTYPGSVLMVYQMAIICLMLAPAFFYYELEAIPGQWAGLLGLAVVTTVFGHTMFVNCFKYFSITTISILSSIQPVYGILIGALVLSEIPAWSTVIGGCLILTSVIVESVRSYR
ncbi:DMT family transporter [Zobellia sp. 1_MG-2023]|uniref:DMT family transporter n=1 Tax=Zobellia sp. 1_MG-2023 TaxID=3062626 RepID=UPI0026E18F81|nr:DMT family transporter [Zobellia sp. 1_MG-2023]MDO6819201.1 DMT family transporter [Zobellia sp. 1_MG-2023]